MKSFALVLFFGFTSLAQAADAQTFTLTCGVRTNTNTVWEDVAEKSVQLKVSADDRFADTRLTLPVKSRFGAGMTVEAKLWFSRPLPDRTAITVEQSVALSGRGVVLHDDDQSQDGEMPKGGYGEAYSYFTYEHAAARAGHTGPSGEYIVRCSVK